MRKKTGILLTVFMPLFLNAQRYVDGAGLCGGNSPCYTTIQAAVTAASSGETVQVYPGTYTELVTIDKPLILQSVAGPSSTTINYTTPGYYIAPIMIVADNGSHSGGVTIGGASGRGFTIIGADVTNDVTGGAFESAAIIIGSNSNNTISNITISYNEIRANGDLAILSYFKPDDTYTNVTVNNNQFTGKTYISPPVAGGYFSHGNVPRFGIGINPGTTNFIFDRNNITTNSGEVVSGTDIGRGFIYAEPKGGTFTNNIFNPTFANGAATRAIMLIGGSNVSIGCNYFSMANSNNAPFYIKAISNPPSYSVTTVAANNTFVLPGGVIVTDSIGKNTLFSGTPANSTYPAPGCSVLPLRSIILTVQKTSPTLCYVQWQTIGEKDIRHFILETSTDGINFSHHSTVASKGNGDHLYQVGYFKKAGTTRTFFRIKSVDAQTGRNDYSSITSIVWVDKVLQMYPNPANNYVIIDGAPEGVIKEIKLFNALGKQVLHQTFNGTRFLIPITQLSRGIYYYEIRTDSKTMAQSGKLVIQ